MNDRPLKRSLEIKPLQASKKGKSRSKVRTSPEILNALPYLGNSPKRGSGEGVITRGDRRVKLRPREYRILRFLSKKIERDLSKAEITKGADLDPGISDNRLENHLYVLNRKMARAIGRKHASFIEVKQEGFARPRYRFNPPRGFS